MSIVNRNNELPPIYCINKTVSPYYSSFHFVATSTRLSDGSSVCLINQHIFTEFSRLLFTLSGLNERMNEWMNHLN